MTSGRIGQTDLRSTSSSLILDDDIVILIVILYMRMTIIILKRGYRLYTGQIVTRKTFLTKFG